MPIPSSRLIIAPIACALSLLLSELRTTLRLTHLTVCDRLTVHGKVEKWKDNGIASTLRYLWKPSLLYRPFFRCVMEFISQVTTVASTGHRRDNELVLSQDLDGNVVHNVFEVDQISFSGNATGCAPWPRYQVTPSTQS